LKRVKILKIEELVGSLQTYELSLPPVKKLKTIALKASKKKVEASSKDDSEEEEKAVAMLAKNFRRLMRNDWFKKKFSEKMKNAPKEAEPEEAEKKDPRGTRFFELIVGTSRRAKGRHTMWLLVMTRKKKKLLS